MGRREGGGGAMWGVVRCCEACSSTATIDRIVCCTICHRWDFCHRNGERQQESATRNCFDSLCYSVYQAIANQSLQMQYLNMLETLCIIKQFQCHCVCACACACATLSMWPSYEMLAIYYKSKSRNKQSLSYAMRHIEYST